MTTQFYRKAAFAISLLGALFSGYLSGIKFFTKTCAFNESCPLFLGYPACYFGFALFLILFIISFSLWRRKISFAAAAKANTFVSALGILFAGYLGYPEVRGMIEGTFENKFLGLSTCVYGLIFFALMFIISLVTLRSKRYN